MKIKNPFVLTAHAARTATKDPLQKYKFRVSISGVDGEMGFQKVSGLSYEVNSVEYNESGFEYTHKLPGRPKVGDVTFERGIFADSSLQDKVLSVMNNKDFRSSITITMYDRFGNPKRRWVLEEAWFSKWEGSDLDTTSDDVAIETATCVFEYYNPKLTGTVTK